LVGSCGLMSGQGKPQRQVTSSYLRQRPDLADHGHQCPHGVEFSEWWWAVVSVTRTGSSCAGP